MVHPVEDFVRLCLAQKGKRYVWAAAGPDEFDCSGLVMWAAHQLGVQLPHYSGSQYDACTHISIQQAIHERGALIFEGENASQHVVVSLGNGTTIEARGRAYGVGTWSVDGRPWSCAALIPGFSYLPGVQPGPQSPPWPGIVYRLTQPRHMGGDAVKWIQRRLEAHGWNGGTYGVDGDFGGETQAAVISFQRAQKIVADGEVGPQTWSHLAS